MYFVELQCGKDDVETLENYRDMFMPMMRDRCPGETNGSIGCKAAQAIVISLIVAGFLAGIWAIAITFAWYRLRKRFIAQKSGNEKMKLFIEKPCEIQPLKMETYSIGN